LKQVLAKQVICERVLAAGQHGYESMVPERDQVEGAQEALKTIRQEKQALREENMAMTREIGALIEQIVGAQSDLHETLKELASFGDDSPYMPSQAVSHFPPAAGEDKQFQVALSQLESRITEIEEHQNITSLISGFRLEDFTGASATFTLDLKTCAESALNENEIQGFIHALQSNDPSSMDEHFRLTLHWTLDCVLTQVTLSMAAHSFQDILETGMEDNSPSFIMREVSHRVSCFSHRYADILKVNQSDRVTLKSSTTGFERLLDFSVSDLPNITIRLNVPLQYPSQSVRFVHVVAADGTIIESTDLKTRRFTSLEEGLDAVLAAL
jgi:hypothetical protein